MARSALRLVRALLGLFIEIAGDIAHGLLAILGYLLNALLGGQRRTSWPRERGEGGVQSQVPALRSARLIYHDNGRRTLRNRRYRVSSRPDFLFELPNGALAVLEYKSREVRRIYQSDRQQTRASVLAARAEYGRVDRAFVLTGSGYWEEVSVPRDDHALYQLIEEDVRAALNVKQGKQPPHTSQRQKCKGCAMAYACK